MTSYRTVVDPPRFEKKLGYETPALFIGSCFTTSIGGRLVGMKFPVMVNPFGVMYNPVSVGNVLEHLMTKKHFQREDLHEQNGRWFSLKHDTSFSGTDREKVLEHINNDLTAAETFFKKCHFLFVSLGTAWVYEWKDDGHIVSNCHKLPAAKFTHRLLSPGEIINYYDKLLSQLFATVPDIQVIFTISPIRHWKNGPEGNQLSKSILFVAVHELLKKFPGMQYFPAYEMVMDDLRDYRFYDEDMLHLRKEAVDYIFDGFVKAIVAPEALPVMKEVEKIWKALLHRPLKPDTHTFRTFAENQLKRIRQLEKKYPFLDMNNEKEYFSRSL